MIKYTPIGFTVDLQKNDRRKQKAIFRNKLKILKIAEAVGDQFFIMSDLDIIYGYGIQEMEKFLIAGKDYGAVALYPHPGPTPDSSNHVSTSFMMIRTEAIKGLKMEYTKGCFCIHLIRELDARGWKSAYIDGKVIHANNGKK